MMTKFIFLYLALPILFLHQQKLPIIQRRLRKMSNLRLSAEIYHRKRAAATSNRQVGKRQNRQQLSNAFLPTEIQVRFSKVVIFAQGLMSTTWITVKRMHSLLRQ